MNHDLVFVGNPWASSEIRGRQIAERMERKFIGFNEAHTVNTNDPIVAIKLAFESPERFQRIFVDVVDGFGVIPHYYNHSNVRFIAISELAKDFLKLRGCENVVVIPEHHCNFERFTRDASNEIKTIGFIGYPNRFGLPPEAVAERMIAEGFRYLHKTDFKDRKEVCEFYKEIDIQITFGDPRTTSSMQMPPELKNPLKLENAGSFKIPTVGYPEPNYELEFANAYLPAYSLDEIIDLCKMLRGNEKIYNLYAERAYRKAKEYHIDKVIELYRRLEDAW